MRLVENTQLPNWWVSGRPLSRDELYDLGNLTDLIDDEHFDLEWRLCALPIAVVMPHFDPTRDSFESSDERLADIRSWYAKLGVAQALEKNPIVLLMQRGQITEMFDGWHRMKIAIEVKAPRVYAAVGADRVSG